MTKWIKCDWLLEKEKRPTKPGYYRLIISGDSESEDGYALYEYPDHPVWASLDEPTPNYVDNPSEPFGFPMLDQAEPTYQPLCIFGGDTDNIIAWYGPVELPPKEEWTEIEHVGDEIRNLPTENGLYIGMVYGDSEYDGGYCLYAYDDYESFFSLTGPDLDGEPTFRFSFDEEIEWLFSWIGPIIIPPVDCF